MRRFVAWLLLLGAVVLTCRVFGIGPDLSLTEIFAGEPDDGPDWPGPDDELHSPDFDDLDPGDADGEAVRQLGTAGEPFGQIRDGGQAAADAARLVARAERSGGEASAMVAAIGADNDALYSEPGRRYLRRTLEVVGTGDPTGRFRLLSRLFLALATGAADPSDREAAALLAEIRGRLRESRAANEGGGPLTVRVEPGDTLSGILARLRAETGRSIALADVLAANRITDPNRIRAGQELRIPAGDSRIEVFVGTAIVTVVEDGLVVEDFDCAVSREASAGAGQAFRVFRRLEDPEWRTATGEVIPPGDPRNPLGRTFLKLVDGEGDPTPFGIHGGRRDDAPRDQRAIGQVALTDEDLERLLEFSTEGTEIRFSR